MSQSKNPGNPGSPKHPEGLRNARENSTDSKDGNPLPSGDAGRARNREVSAGRNTVTSSRGSASAVGMAAATEGREEDTERLRRRARFLRERNEAKELRDRVQPRRTRTARMRQAMRMRTFRW